MFAIPLPQLALGALVNFFFSGFILGKTPFALSPKFRVMLQVSKQKGKNSEPGKAAAACAVLRVCRRLRLAGCWAHGPLAWRHEQPDWEGWVWLTG